MPTRFNSQIDEFAGYAPAPVPIPTSDSQSSVDTDIGSTASHPSSAESAPAISSCRRSRTAAVAAATAATGASSTSTSTSASATPSHLITIRQNRLLRTLLRAQLRHLSSSADTRSFLAHKEGRLGLIVGRLAEVRAHNEARKALVGRARRLLGLAESDADVVADTSALTARSAPSSARPTSPSDEQYQPTRTPANSEKSEPASSDSAASSRRRNARLLLVAIEQVANICLSGLDQAAALLAARDNLEAEVERILSQSQAVLVTAQRLCFRLGPGLHPPPPQREPASAAIVAAPAAAPEVVDVATAVSPTENAGEEEEAAAPEESGMPAHSPRSLPIAPPANPISAAAAASGASANSRFVMPLTTGPSLADFSELHPRGIRAISRAIARLLGQLRQLGARRVNTMHQINNVDRLALAKAVHWSRQDTDYGTAILSQLWADLERLASDDMEGKSELVSLVREAISHEDGYDLVTELPLIY